MNEKIVQPISKKFGVRHGQIGYRLPVKVDCDGTQFVKDVAMVMTETYTGLHELTCTHVYSKINEFPYENRWEYRCGDRTAIVIVDDMGQAASSWDQTAPATLVTRSKGEVSSRPRKFNMFPYAQREAIKFCHNNNSETMVDLELTNLDFSREMEYTSRFHDFMAGKLVDRERMARLIKEATGLDINDPNTEEQNFRIAQKYVSSMLVKELQQLIWKKSSLLDSVDTYQLRGDQASVDTTNAQIAAIDTHIEQVEQQIVQQLSSSQQED